MKVEKAYTIPKDWGMTDLSPKSYAKLVADLQADEQATLAFSNKIGMNKPSVVITGIACDLDAGCSSHATRITLTTSRSCTAVEA